MRQWKVALKIYVSAYIDTPDDWDDPEGVASLARDAISLWDNADAVLEIENIAVDDVVEIGLPIPAKEFTIGVGNPR